MNADAHFSTAVTDVTAAIHEKVGLSKRQERKF